MLRIEIMRPGNFTAMQGQQVAFTEDALRLAATAYDAQKAPAPVVIGHPAIEAPAYGWVKGMDFADGTLGAYVAELEPAFAEAVKAGRYRKVSASFFQPSAPSNPRPGVLYLRHVGFLGAAAPAVPGLKPVSFAAEDAEFMDFAHEAEAAPIRDADATPHGRMLARLADLERRDRERGRRDVAEFCDRLVKEARLPSGLRDLAFAAISEAPEDTMLSFGEGEAARRVGLRPALMELLGKRPPMVQFGAMVDRGGPGGAVSGEGIDLPAGYAADPEREAFARRAEGIAAERKVSFAEAVRIAEREGAR